MSRRRAWVVWVLLLAVPACGLAGVAAGLFGSSHRHHSALAASEGIERAGLHDFRRMADATVTARIAHDHSVWQRHQHDRSDASVVSLDGQAQEESLSDRVSTYSGSDALGTGAGEEIAVPEAAEIGRCWPRAAACALAWFVVVPLERPPKA